MLRFGFGSREWKHLCSPAARMPACNRTRKVIAAVSEEMDSRGVLEIL